MMYLAATVFPAPLSPLGVGEGQKDQQPAGREGWGGESALSSAHSFIHSLLCARHYTRFWGNNSEQDR